MSLAFFIEVLGENPGLQQLTILNHGPFCTDNTAEFPGIAELPCLTHLSLGWCDSRLILSHVRTSARRIDVSKYLTSGLNTGEEVLEAIPADILFRNHDHTPRELKLSITSDQLHLIITDNSGIIISVSEDLDIFEDDCVLSDRLLYEVSGHDTFCGLTHLVIEVEKGHSRSDLEVSCTVWEELFGQCKRLECLEIKQIPLGNLIVDLREGSYDQDTNLVFDGTHLTVLRLDFPIYSDTQEQCQTLEALTALICSRGQPDSYQDKVIHGKALEEVEIGVYVEPEDLWHLQIDEHLAQWKRCGVKKGQVLNHDVVVTGFGE
jgi:hypothetical protein